MLLIVSSASICSIERCQTRMRCARRRRSAKQRFRARRAPSGSALQGPWSGRPPPNPLHLTARPPLCGARSERAARRARLGPRRRDVGAHSGHGQAGLQKPVHRRRRRERRGGGGDAAAAAGAARGQRAAAGGGGFDRVRMRVCTREVWPGRRRAQLMRAGRMGAAGRASRCPARVEHAAALAAARALRSYPTPAALLEPAPNAAPHTHQSAALLHSSAQNPSSTPPRPAPS